MPAGLFNIGSLAAWSHLMGVTLSYITSIKPFARDRKSPGGAVWWRVAGWGAAWHVWARRGAAVTISVAAMTVLAEEDELKMDRDYANEPELGTLAKVEPNDGSSKMMDFVLAEVRKRLEPNPETEIVELKIDPDYHGAKDTYLVNAVLDAHGRTLTVGVLVTVRQTNDRLQADVGYIQ
ncbi:MAG: hypothetical protein QM715_15560 [Nibricoccus sp.]